MRRPFDFEPLRRRNGWGFTWLDAAVFLLCGLTLLYLAIHVVVAIVRGI